MKNCMNLSFSALAENEGFARVTVAAFLAQLDPTIEEMEDVKTAVSEAVTNCIIHGYALETAEELPQIRLSCELNKNWIHIKIQDDGVGIRDLRQAMEPLYTSKPEQDRSGMGFSFMEAFMDKLEVESKPGEGTVVRMAKQITNPLRREAAE